MTETGIGTQGDDLVRKLLARLIDVSQIKYLRVTRIQTRLMAAFLFLSAIPLLISSLISYQRSSAAIQAQISTYSVQLMDEASIIIETQLAYLESLSNELSEMSIIQKDFFNYDRMNDLGKLELENAIRISFVEHANGAAFNIAPDITSVNLLPEERVVIGPGQGNYTSDQLAGLYRATEAASDIYLLQELTDVNGQLQIALSRVVRSNHDGQAMGVLILTFKESFLARALAAINTGNGAEIFILDGDGTIISSNNRTDLPPGQRFADPTLPAQLQNSLQNNQPSLNLTLQNEKQFVTFNTIDARRWFMVSVIPYAVIQAESRTLMWNIILIGLLCLVIAVPVSYVIALSISVPLGNLRNKMNEVKFGNLEIRVNDNNEDEIAEVTSRFNEMVTSIRQLMSENAETQKEIVYRLTAAAEARSNETGNHIFRVAQYSQLLALKSGLPEEEVETLKLAGTMHDIGKIAIPDSILLKPGKLTPEEFEVMKTHSEIGYKILMSTDKPIWRISAQIAREHHERYDGAGYPRGLRGEEISLFGRIVALADVFDALSTDRVYKKAWEIDRIIEYIREQSGRQFDPRLTTIFLDNMAEVKNIRETLQD